MILNSLRWGCRLLGWPWTKHAASGTHSKTCHAQGKWKKTQIFGMCFPRHGMPRARGRRFKVFALTECSPALTCLQLACILKLSTQVGQQDDKHRQECIFFWRIFDRCLVANVWRHTVLAALYANSFQAQVNLMKIAMPLWITGSSSSALSRRSAGGLWKSAHGLGCISSHRLLHHGHSCHSIDIPLNHHLLVHLQRGP